MKKLFFILILFFGYTYSYAQQGQNKSQLITPEQKAEETVQKLKTDISLTDEQIPKVKAITVDRINKVTAAHKKIGSDKQRLQAANKLIYDEWEAQLKGIVSADQYNQYLATKGQK